MAGLAPRAFRDDAAERRAPAPSLSLRGHRACTKLRRQRRRQLLARHGAAVGAPRAAAQVVGHLPRFHERTLRECLRRIYPIFCVSDCVCDLLHKRHGRSVARTQRTHETLSKARNRLESLSLSLSLSLEYHRSSSSVHRFFRSSVDSVFFCFERL